jgi:hypothetical protein
MANDDMIHEEKHEVLRFPTRDQLDHSKTMEHVKHNAKAATEKEHRMTLWQGIKLYPKAVMFSVIVSLFDISMKTSRKGLIFWSRYQRASVWKAMMFAS